MQTNTFYSKNTDLLALPEREENARVLREVVEKSLICWGPQTQRTAAPQAEPSAGWRDITTKPPLMECEERGLYTSDDGTLFYFKPTHWRPLPAPPQGGNDGR